MLAKLVFTTLVAWALADSARAANGTSNVSSDRPSMPLEHHRNSSDEQRAAISKNLSGEANASAILSTDVNLSSFPQPSLRGGASRAGWTCCSKYQVPWGATEPEKGSSVIYHIMGAIGLGLGFRV